jgi:hypothetical protein
MNPTPLLQTIGNGCVGFATLILLLRLQDFLSSWARKEVSNDQWVTPALFLLLPIWLLLMGALLCVTASGGFDSLRLGRPALYALTIAATLALAAVTFVFVSLYLRPGFTPRALYHPFIFLIPLSTVLLVVLSLNPRLATEIPVQWVRLPWTIFTALSLVVCAGFLGQWTIRTGIGGAVGLAHRIRNPGPSTQEILEQISAFDPEKNFEDLLRRVNRHESREVREAAAARLRSHPNFLERLSTELETGYVEVAVGFLRDATLSPAEQARLARPARKAMQRWVDRIPAPNYTTKKHLKELRKWGSEILRILPEKFAATGVDFTRVSEDFKDKVDGTP